jgi:very-short-patch-repair endonuclease
MAAVLSCGPNAVLSHQSAAELWGIRRADSEEVEVSVPLGTFRRRAGVFLHRRTAVGEAEVTRREGIPVTSVVCTLADLAARLDRDRLEAAINEADKLDLIDASSLRTALEDRTGRRGVRPLRKILDRGEFVLTDSELERRFLPIARRAGLKEPRTQAWVNGFRVDFHWPALGLIVETDGLRYHRTPSEQARDRMRDQAHIAAGLIPLRFTHWQVRYDREHVERTLRAAIRSANRRLTPASGDD